MGITGVFGSAGGNSTGVNMIAYGAGTQGSCLTSKGVNNWMSAIMPVNIPGNSVGAGGYLDVNYEWSLSVNGGAGVNWFSFALSGVTIGPITSLSVGGSYRGSLRIRNVDNANIIATLAAGDGNYGTGLFTMSCDMTKDQQFTFFSNGGTSPNCIALKGWSIEAHNISATATPAALLPGRKCFYGINAHIDEGNTPTIANRIADMKLLGFNVLRVSWFGPTHSSGGVLATTWIQDMASAFAADSGSLGLNMMVMVGCGPGSGLESDAYSAGFAQGVYAATNLGSRGVKLYELGNEIDADGKIKISTTLQGTTLADYSFSTSASSQAAWITWRGNMRGCYDGIKSVQPDAMVGSNAFCNGDIWCSDALWNGTDPFGGHNNPQVRWDWTNWHLYTEGDATDIPYTGNTLNFNMIKYLHHAYGKPICITEWNPSDAVTASANLRINNWLTTWYTNQDKWNIGSTVYYSWFDGSFQIATQVAPTTLNSMGQTYKDFISAHPALK